MDETVLAAAPGLKAIAKYGVGLDNIDLAACKQRGIAVSRTVGANSNAVADYALTLMLMVARKAGLIDRRCRQKDWGKITSNRPVRQNPWHYRPWGHWPLRGQTRPGVRHENSRPRFGGGTKPGPPPKAWNALMWTASAPRPILSPCTRC